MLESKEETLFLHPFVHIRTNVKVASSLGSVTYALLQKIEPTDHIAYSITLFSTPELRELSKRMNSATLGILCKLILRMEYYNFLLVFPSTAKDIGVSTSTFNKQLKKLLKLNVLTEQKLDAETRSTLAMDYKDSNNELRRLPNRARLFSLHKNIAYRGNPETMVDMPNRFTVSHRSIAFSRTLTRAGRRTIGESLSEGRGLSGNGVLYDIFQTDLEDEYDNYC